MTTAPVHWIRDPQTIEALASPLRQSLIDRLEVLGPCPVRELAASLGLPPDSLYYHVRVLERAGLLRPEGTRGTDGRDEVLYALTRRRWHIRYEPGDARNVRAVRKVTAGILRQAELDFDVGLAHPKAVVSGLRRNLWSLRLEASLTADEIETVQQHLQAVVDVLRRPRDPGRGTLCALSWVLAPIAAHRGRRRKRAAGAPSPRERDTTRRSTS